MNKDLPILGVHEEEAVLNINNALPPCLRQTPEQAVQSTRLQTQILLSQGKNVIGTLVPHQYSATRAIISGDGEECLNAPLFVREQGEATDNQNAPLVEPRDETEREDDHAPLRERTLSVDSRSRTPSRSRSRSRSPSTSPSTKRRRKERDSLVEERHKLNQYREDLNDLRCQLNTQRQEFDRQRYEYFHALQTVCHTALRQMEGLIRPPPPTYRQVCQPEQRQADHPVQRQDPIRTSVLDMINQPKPKPKPRPYNRSYRPPQQSQVPMPMPKPQPQPQPQPHIDLPPPGLIESGKII